MLAREFFMREEQAIRIIKLRLLALVLALALTWYALNPAPIPACQVRRDEGERDENRREVKPAFEASRRLARTEAGVGELPVNLRADAAESGELEWPEIIDISEN